MLEWIWTRVSAAWSVRPPTLRLTAKDIVAGIISGFVVGLLLFVFSTVFAELIFGAHPELAKHVDIGVLEQTLTVLVGSLLTVALSGNPIGIAGPDITSALFLTSAAKQVAEAIVEMPEIGNERILPTVLVMIALATVAIGVLWIFMGYYSLTRALEYMPAPILSGFVASIGYKVLCKAVDTATGGHTSLAYWGVESAPLEVAHFAQWETWVHLAPAVPIGVALFILKREHWGTPYIFIPIIIFAPVFIFYVLLAAADISRAEAREQKWLFAEFEQTDFWTLWEPLYGGFFRGEVVWSAIPAAAAPLSILMLMLTIDMLGQQVRERDCVWGVWADATSPPVFTQAHAPRHPCLQPDSPARSPTLFPPHVRDQRCTHARIICLSILFLLLFFCFYSFLLLFFFAIILLFAIVRSFAPSFAGRDEEDAHDAGAVPREGDYRYGRDSHPARPSRRGARVPAD